MPKPPKKKMLESEWSHFVEGQDVDSHEMRLSISPDEDQRASMSKRLDLDFIEFVKADVTLKRRKGNNVVHVMGRMKAKVQPVCVVTQEPFDLMLDETLEGWFVDKESAVSFAEVKRERDVVKMLGEIEITDEQSDPEPMVNGMIDLGEFVTQNLSLALPAYPRQDGAEHELITEEAQLNDKSPLRKNPFEALKDWKEKR